MLTYHLEFCTVQLDPNKNELYTEIIRSGPVFLVWFPTVSKA